MSTKDVARQAWWMLRWLLGWTRRHLRWVLVVTTLGPASGSVWGTTAGMLVVLVGLSPALAACVWAATGPVSYERLVAGPYRRYGWRRSIKRRWADVAVDCGLSATKRVASGGESVPQVIVPRLRRVKAIGWMVTLWVGVRSGLTAAEVLERCDKVATAFGAVSDRAWVENKGTVCVEMVMADLLTTPTYGTEPDPRLDRKDGLGVTCVRLGRTQSGAPWIHKTLGPSTLCAGKQGSGKGSILWGFCLGLAPAVHVDLVRLWGIDLKGGVELEMGAPLFSARAYTPEAALQVLRLLEAMADERALLMAGVTRDFRPSIGDPIHVLVIDELAVLIAYSDPAIRREAERILSKLLAIGRAVGVVVKAFLQDPRKEVVNMRDLYAERIALRLKTSDETTMVLGDGIARLAPAHHISPAVAGTCWIVHENGAVDRTRADYWTDDQIRSIARRYPTSVHIDLDAPKPEATEATSERTQPLRAEHDDRKPRSPRAPRAPRAPRKPRGPRAAGESGPESAPGSGSSADGEDVA